MTESISYEDWMRDIDREINEGRACRGGEMLTPEMLLTIQRARAGGVSWRRISTLAKSWGWPLYDRGSLSDWFSRWERGQAAKDLAGGA